MEWLKRVKARDWCEFGGVGAVVVGGFLIVPAVGFIVLGISLLLFSVAMTRE
jgi:preprotein translocase subunit Sss1